MARRRPPQGRRSEGGVTKGLLLATEGIADRNSFAESAWAAELVIVADEIGVKFRPNEDAAGDVKLKPTPDVSHQVLAADVVGATAEAAIHIWRVEPNALSPEPAHDLRTSAVAKSRSPDPIEVIRIGRYGWKP